MKRLATVLSLLLGACAGGNRGSDLPDFTVRGDLSITPADATVAGPMKVVVNEIAPNGTDPATDPDWVELKNLGATPFDLTGYQVRDDVKADLTELPAGTMVPPNGYLVLLCDDHKVAAGPEGVHLPFKISGSNGDKFHFLDPRGNELEGVKIGAGEVYLDKTWSRLPDGTGDFQNARPTRGAGNRQ